MTHNSALRKHAQLLLDTIEEYQGQPDNGAWYDRIIKIQDESYEAGFSEGYAEALTYADRSRAE